MEHPVDTQFEVEIGYRAEGMSEPAFRTYPVEGWVGDPKGRLVPLYDGGKTFHDEHPLSLVHIKPVAS
jgi:hypothetical protein